MLSRSIRSKMKFTSRAGSNPLAVALASSALSYMPTAHHTTLMATAFSLNVQQGRASSAAGFGSTTQRSMSKMDQSFKTWSFDEPCKTMAWSKMSSATVSVTGKTDKWDEEADLVVIGVFAPKKDEDADDSEEKEEEEPTVALEGAAKDLDEKLDGALTHLMLENAKAFNHGAEAGSMTPTLRVFRDGKYQRFVVMGMGTVPDKEKDDALLGVGSKVGKGLASTCDAEKKVKTATVLLPGDAGSSSSLLTDLSTAFHSNLYADNRFRTGKKIKTPAEDLEVLSLISEGSAADGADAAVEAGKKLASGVFLTKDIVNGPHNVLNSVSLADTAKRIAEESGGSITCKILGKEECEERGMGAYLGVARGSETPPQFIHLTYTPPDGKVNKRVGVIGKGLLFDTGGYNIKVGMMELMKFDCGGAAAVLGKNFDHNCAVG
jgi:leucyl aminopeptidase